MNTNTYGPVSTIGPKITEPTTLGRAQETLNHIATLEMHTSHLRSILFGEGESCNNPATEPSTIDGMLAVACSRVALLCGEVSTIKSRLGVPLPIESNSCLPR